MTANKKFEKIEDDVLGEVAGGAAGWSNGSGNYVNHGTHIVYTVSVGEALSSIAPRFGVTVEEIEQWNNLKGAEAVRAGNKLTIYPRVYC